MPPGLHHAVSENFDFACLFHYLYYNVAAEPEILSAEGFDSQDVPLPNNFIQRSKNLSVEVSDVPSPDKFIQFIDDNMQDAANNVDARSNLQQVEYIQQTQVEYVQQAPVTYAAPQTHAAPQILPTAASMVAVPQQSQFAPVDPEAAVKAIADVYRRAVADDTLAFDPEAAVKAIADVYRQAVADDDDSDDG